MFNHSEPRSGPAWLGKDLSVVNSMNLTRRVLNRTLAAAWRQKGSLLLCIGIGAAMLCYVAALPPTVPGVTPAAAAAPDCADAVMAAVVGQGAAAAQQHAFECMDPDLQQRVFAQGLAAQYRSIAATAVSDVSRVATHTADDGAELVYYSASAGSQSVGFVVHLGADGKATTIS